MHFIALYTTLTLPALVSRLAQVLTFPLIGNYGVPDPTLMDANGLPIYFESTDIHIAGLVVSSYSWEHSHWTAKHSLGDWLAKAGVPAIYGVDTRNITKMIRETGAGE